MVLLEGSWYRSWKDGGKYVSVGFSGDAFYDKMDMDTFIEKANEAITQDFEDGYTFAG